MPRKTVRKTAVLHWTHHALAEAARFSAVFLVVAGLLYVISEPLDMPLRQYTADAGIALLNLAGMPSYGGSSESGPVVYTDGISALIISMCTGRIELCVLAGLIVASRDRTKRRRALGLVGAVIAISAFNPIRVAATLAYFSPFLHDVLFRAGVLAFIIGYYAVWYLSPGARRVEQPF